MAIEIRKYAATDREAMKRITTEAFPKASIDKLIEDRYGVRHDTPWWHRKCAQIDADCDANPAGIFVATDERGAIVAYITTRLVAETKMGWIPNLAVTPACQGQGIGRKLIAVALEYFRAAGMTTAKIETLATNEVGNHLYPSMGFEELVRQVHFVMEL